MMLLAGLVREGRGQSIEIEAKMVPSLGKIQKL